MLPYSFLLIATVSPINWADADFIATLGGWADDGFVALRKQSPTVSSDYIDIVKHSDGAATFGGVRQIQDF